MWWTRIYEVYMAGPVTFLFVAFYSVTSLLAIFSVTWFGLYEPNGVDIFSPPLPRPSVDILALSGMDDEKSKFRSEFQEAMKRPIWHKYATDAAFYSWGIRRLYFDNSEEREILQTLGLGGRYSSCVVVGNVDTVLNAGDEIDSHDVVIRLDEVDITGNGENVGRRTSISLGSVHMLLQCGFNSFMQRYETGTITVVYIPDGVAQSIKLINLCERTRNNRDFVFTDPRFDLLSMKIAKYYSLKRFFKDNNNRTIEDWIALYNGKFRYSSGFQAVILAFVTCKNISLYGFHFNSSKTNEDGHDYEAEMDFYRDLSISNKRIPFLNKFGLTDIKVQIH